MANIPSDLQYITHINECWIRDVAGSQTFKNLIGQTSFCSGSRDWLYTATYDTNIMSFITNTGGYWHDETKGMQLPTAVDLNLSPTTIRIDVDTQSQETVNVTYSNINVEYLYNLFTCPNGYYGGNGRLIRFNFSMSYDPTLIFVGAMDDTVLNFQQTVFSTLADAIEYIYVHYANIDLYVDGENWVKASPTVNNWQSVPSISGKNGILSLVTLDSESINDGEPVSGAAVSVFDQAPSDDNNIKNLADTYGGGEESSAVDVTVKYKVTLPPGGSFSILKIVAKKDSIPEDATDGDKIVDISPTKTKKTVTGLDENSMYYFKIFAEDSNSNTSESDEKHINTSEEEGVPFDYTGSIQEFTVPETGMYSLETWGAQGQGEGSARGGYGAYAYAETFLTEGQKLYIGVGGQNGYNGGGNYQHGNIRNILIPDSGQSIIIDERCWTQTGTTPSAVYPDSTLTCFALGNDMGKIRNEIGRDNYVVLWERNGIKCYVGITQTNASYGEPKFCCAIYNEKNERVLGSLDIRSTYSQEFGPYCGFDAATEDWYNSNVRARLYHWGLAYGVDDTNHLGYIVHCYGQHRGYYENTNLYLPQASYDSSYYGWNAAKLYDALIRASQ